MPHMIEMENDVLHETALLAEAALAEDWLKPEEDEAWKHLQPMAGAQGKQ
jgi:hypothetical protein